MHALWFRHSCWYVIKWTEIDVENTSKRSSNFPRSVRTVTAATQSMLRISNFNPLPDDKILDGSELKQIADGILTHSHTMTPFDAPGKQAF